MADFFNVGARTFDAWLQRHAALRKAVHDGRAMPDDLVERRLFERAIGYAHPEDKVVMVAGEPVAVPTVKHYPPETSAASLWLRNRRPDRWREISRHEHTGRGGGPIETKDVTPDDVRKRVEDLFADPTDDGADESGGGDPVLH